MPIIFSSFLLLKTTIISIGLCSLVISLKFGFSRMETQALCIHWMKNSHNRQSIFAFFYLFFNQYFEYYYLICEAPVTLAVVRSVQAFILGKNWRDIGIWNSNPDTIEHSTLNFICITHLRRVLYSHTNRCEGQIIRIEEEEHNKHLPYKRW